jgi:DNA polymerase (family 10)
VDESGREAAGPTNRHAIALALREIGEHLQILGESPYRARAYLQGADALERFGGELRDLFREDRLTDIPGIGPALAAQIQEIDRTGESALLTSLRSRLPPGALELMRVQGLTLKRAGALHEALGITSVEELRAACETGRVRAIKGFGERTEQRILKAIDALANRRPALLLNQATLAAERVLTRLKAWGVGRAEIVGSLRRGVESIEEIEILAEASEAPSGINGFATVWTADADEFGSALVRRTGSAAHVARLDDLARERGFSADERIENEADVYARLGLPFIPPELRENDGEIEAALSGELPTDLIALPDLRGFVHCHTTYSDGIASLERMVRAAETMGAEFITITDHSPSAHYADGLSVDRLKEQWEEIDAIQEKVKVRILRGTESDILADGSLDYPDSILERMDVVIASIHGRFRMDEDAMTRRISRAMSHPFFKIWGHAQGRLIGRRPPFDCRMEEVLDVIAASRAAIEISGDPRRLDMVPRWIRAARERGIPFVISTDAHSVGSLQNARYGVLNARRGWVERGEVLNARPLDEFLRAVRPSN